MAINSNSDLPKCLDTKDKQVRKAKELAALHTGMSAKEARGPPFQGFFSRTMIVTLQDGGERVIQFRPEELDMQSFKTARKFLGSVVPETELIKDEELAQVGIWVYVMPRVPGTPWIRAISGKGREPVVNINRSLGTIFSKGFIQADSSEVVNNDVRIHLEKFISSGEDYTAPYKDIARDLNDKLDQLKTLPLFVAHFDLNEVNILLSESLDVSGIVDWELSRPLPFGMGFGRIHTLAGEYSGGEFLVPDNFEEAERAFWDAIIAGMAEDVRAHILANVEMVQVAVMLGTLLGAFELTDGVVQPPGKVGARALPKHLSYRIPFIRGTDPPYSR